MRARIGGSSLKPPSTLAPFSFSLLPFTAYTLILLRNQNIWWSKAVTMINIKLVMAQQFWWTQIWLGKFEEANFIWPYINNAIWFFLIQNECILYRGVNWETFWSVKVLPEVIWFNHPPAAASPSCVAGPQTSGCFLQPWPCVCSCTNYYSAKAGSSGCKKRGELRHCGSLSNLNLLRDLRSGNGCQYNVVLSI